MTSYSPPPFPLITSKKPDGSERLSTTVGLHLMGALHAAYRGGISDEVIKDLWLNGLEAYRMAALVEANEAIASRVRPGMDWKQATQNFHGQVVGKGVNKHNVFLMICEAMLEGK